MYHGGAGGEDSAAAGQQVAGTGAATALWQLPPAAAAAQAGTGPGPCSPGHTTNIIQKWTAGCLTEQSQLTRG